MEFFDGKVTACGNKDWIDKNIAIKKNICTLDSVVVPNLLTLLLSTHFYALSKS